MLLLSPNRSLALPTHPDAPPRTDLHAVCRPRYHALVPHPCDRAARPAVFATDDARPGHGPDDDAERWDGLA